MTRKQYRAPRTGYPYPGQTQQPEQYKGVPLTTVLLQAFKNDKKAVIEFLDSVQNAELGIIKQRANDAGYIQSLIKKVQDDAAATAKALEIDG